MTDPAKEPVPFMQDEVGPLIEDFDVTEEEYSFLSGGHGIRVTPTEFHGFGGLVHQPEAYTFVKWLKHKKPEIPVEIEDAPVVDLRSAEYWLPLVFLATDVTLPFYLNVAAAYVYDMARGALKREKASVYLEVIHQDEKAGKSKKFIYRGPVDGLKAFVKKSDLSSIMQD